MDAKRQNGEAGGGSDDAPWFCGNGHMQALARGHDWTASALGATCTWPPSLQTAVDIVFSAEAPIALFWGAHHVLLYNDSFADLIGSVHPLAFGRPAGEALGQGWVTIEPVLIHVMATGTGCRVRNYPESGVIEKHRPVMDLSFAPIHDHHRRVVGVLSFIQAVPSARGTGSGEPPLSRTTGVMPIISDGMHQPARGSNARIEADRSGTGSANAPHRSKPDRDR